jgi:hypothetical protein
MTEDLIDELELAAVKMYDAWQTMLVYDKGIGGLAEHHPEMAQDMIDWGKLTQDDHADTVLRLIDEIRRLQDVN